VGHGPSRDDGRLCAAWPKFDEDDISKPTFVETRCSLPNVTPEILPRLRCGTVAVPRDHDNPAAGRFNLAVVAADRRSHR